MQHQWNPNFYQISPLFNSISPALQRWKDGSEHWPSLSVFNESIPTEIKNNNGKTVKFVPQGKKTENFSEQYEPRIYERGEVQTREDNWHDFFQVLVWQTYPRTKSLLNELHYNASKKRLKEGINQRSPIENFVTLFDECGAVILTSNARLVEEIKDARWNSIFVKNRDKFGTEIECTVFGHAMFEKAISPYIGMTSHCLFLNVDSDFFLLSREEKNKHIDLALVSAIESFSDITTKLLSPLPLLGVPGWYADQSNEFYNNVSYFRRKREK